MSDKFNIGSIAEQVFKPDEMEWEEREYRWTTGLLEREGGSKRTKDSGGWTRYGISEKAHGSTHVIWDLTEDDARDIYKYEYLRPIVKKVGKNNVAFKIADMNVNIGYPQTVKLVQQALDINIDGKFGKATKTALQEAINGWGEDEVIDALSKVQRNYYDSLRTSNPKKYGKYKGWDDRANYNPIKD